MLCQYNSVKVFVHVVAIAVAVKIKLFCGLMLLSKSTFDQEVRVRCSGSAREVFRGCSGGAREVLRRGS